MADDKRGREEQARNARRRQQRRAVEEAVARGDEPEPPVDERDLGDLEADLADVEFPATGEAVVAAVGDREVRSERGARPVADLVPDAAVERFSTPRSVRTRVRYPTVAAAMKRVVEAADEHQGAEFGGSQREAYEKTFLALAAVDPTDDDEGVSAIADWIVERISEKKALPGSRPVRRQAAAYCREHGYPVRDDEWLGS